ncbi:MAG: glycosyltransferase [Patescibacteria group bacterium]|nr:glycosyltransferase [Patescibacteria group bacterium]
MGGAEGMLLKLLSGMDNKRFANQVVSLTDVGPIGEQISAQGIPVYALFMPNGRVNASGLVKLWRLLNTLRPRILQTWLYHADLLGLLFGKLALIKNICWNIRGSYHDLKKYRSSTKWTIKMCSIFSSFPDVVIANSYRGREFHVALGYRAKRWSVLPNGFDLNKFKPDQIARAKLLHELGLTHCLNNGNDKGNNGNGNPPMLIGLIARYNPMKDHSTFIKAACSLLKEIRDVHFVLVGKDVDPGNRLLTAQIPSDWNNRFHLLGERNDIESITAGLNIASSSSYGEGFPNILCEAMACEVPCVATDVGDSARIVGNTGSVVSTKDPEALAMAWTEMIGLGEEGRRRLGVAARKRVMDHFELSKIVKKYEALYTSLLG